MTRQLPPLVYVKANYDVRKSRFVLVSWLYAVHNAFELQLVTFHLGVQLIDRVLAKRQIDKRELQLIGIASMRIACKYHEVRTPTIGDWQWVCENSYTAAQIRMMELVVLQTINYNLNYTTPIEYYSQVGQTSNEKWHKCITLMFIFYGQQKTTSELVAAVAYYFGQNICTHTCDIDAVRQLASRIPIRIHDIANCNCESNVLARELQN